MRIFFSYLRNKTNIQQSDAFPNVSLSISAKSDPILGTMIRFYKIGSILKSDPILGRILKSDPILNSDMETSGIVRSTRAFK